MPNYDAIERRFNYLLKSASFRVVNRMDLTNNLTGKMLVSQSVIRAIEHCLGDEFSSSVEDCLDSIERMVQAGDRRRVVLIGLLRMHLASHFARTRNLLSSAMASVPADLIFKAPDYDAVAARLFKRIDEQEEGWVALQYRPWGERHPRINAAFFMMLGAVLGMTAADVFAP